MRKRTLQQYIDHGKAAERSVALLGQDTRKQCDCHPASRLCGTLRRGFTLVEMIVVMAIIGVIIGVGAAGMKGLTEAKGVSSGVSIADSIFSEARSSAIGNGLNTRVAFLSDSSVKGKDEEKYLRLIAVFQQNIETDRWEPTGRGLSLPGKTFYDEIASVSSGTDTMDFPGLGPSSCHFYEFNSQGLIVNAGGGTGDANEAISCIIGSGTAVAGSQRKINVNEKDRGGFVVRKNGRRSLYRDISQMPNRSASGQPSLN